VTEQPGHWWSRWTGFFWCDRLGGRFGGLLELPPDVVDELGLAHALGTGHHRDAPAPLLHGCHTPPERFQRRIPARDER